MQAGHVEEEQVVRGRGEGFDKADKDVHPRGLLLRSCALFWLGDAINLSCRADYRIASSDHAHWISLFFLPLARGKEETLHALHRHEQAS